MVIILEIKRIRYGYILSLRSIIRFKSIVARDAPGEV